MKIPLHCFFAGKRDTNAACPALYTNTTCCRNIFYFIRLKKNIVIFIIIFLGSHEGYLDPSSAEWGSICDKEIAGNGSPCQLWATLRGGENRRSSLLSIVFAFYHLCFSSSSKFRDSPCFLSSSIIIAKFHENQRLSMLYSVIFNHNFKIMLELKVVLAFFHLQW